MKHIIVGIDAGKTAAVACLDLQGNPVLVATKRFGGMDWFIENIRAAGSPVIITSDKKRSSKVANKLAAIFGAVLFVPSEDIGIRKKKTLSAELVESTHERDAFASAKIAYNRYSNKLKQAERLAKQSMAENIDTIQALVIKKYSINEAMKGSKSRRK